MPSQLKLPASPYTKAFRNFCRILQTDPDLRACGTTFQVWEGKKGECDEPTATQLPCLRITPIESTSDLIGEGQHGIKMPLQVDVWVAGGTTASPPADDYLNFVYAVAMAIFPDDDSRREAVDRIKGASGTDDPAFQCKLTRPGLAFVKPKSDGPIFEGTMLFELMIHLSTRA